MNKSVFHPVLSSEVVELSGVEPVSFLVPNADLTSGRPQSLCQDGSGYLVPDPEILFWLDKEGKEYGQRPVAVTRQAREVIRHTLEYQEARRLDGIHREERYLVIEGKGGIGKSYMLQWFFGRAGVPVICEKVPPKEEKADEMLFGNPLAINKNPNNLVETTKSFYKGRGLKNPETLQFLKDHPRELYLALFPGEGGWVNSNHKAYKSFWTKVADLENIQIGQKTVPRMGLFELCYRNGIVLFLDELNRLKESVRDNCMRAFEATKSLETNLGVMLPSEKHPAALVVGAMNGAREFFNTKTMDPAQRRRADIKSIPSYDEKDYRDYAEFLMTGMTTKVNGVTIKWEEGEEQRLAKGATCRSSYLRVQSEVPNEKDPKKIDKPFQKDKALRDFASFHAYMETQIVAALKGKSWGEKIEVDLQEHIPTGPTLMKAFLDKVYQHSSCRHQPGQEGKSIGMYQTIQAMSTAFKEVYIQPLLDRGVPEDRIRQSISFGTYGNKDNEGRTMPLTSMGHMASMFAPMVNEDVEGLFKTKNNADKNLHNLLQPYLEVGGIYPAIQKTRGGVLTEYQQDAEGKPKLVEYKGAVEYPLLDVPNDNALKEKLTAMAVDFEDKLKVDFSR